MWEFQRTNELYHYGVLGMKWGVHRAKNKSNISKSTRKNDNSDMSDDYKEAHIKKSIKSMSDAELKKRLNRIQMEENYSKIKRQKLSKGKRYVDNFIKAATTVSAVSTAAITIYNNFDKIKGIIKRGN